MPAEQGLLPFSPVKNFGLFSNHWLTNRLSLEPEWAELRDSALQSRKGCRPPVQRIGEARADQVEGQRYIWLEPRERCVERRPHFLAGAEEAHNGQNVQRLLKGCLVEVVAALDGPYEQSVGGLHVPVAVEKDKCGCGGGVEGLGEMRISAVRVCQ